MHRTLHRTLRRVAAWAAAITVLVVALPPSSHGEEEWPGLPETDGTFGQAWAGAAQGGISYATRAKQWVRSPDAMVTFRAAASNTGPGLGYDRPCTPSTPTCVSRFKLGGQAFFVSPEGAPAPYGYMAPMTVRSVGFGLMPVEATVQVSQRREGSYPVPFETWLLGGDNYDKTVQPDSISKTLGAVHFEDAVDVRILKVLVDGVDLGLTGECRTATPAPMKVSSPEATIPLLGASGSAEVNAMADKWYATTDPAAFFNPLKGGQLSGTITIPPFTGCTTASGDDLSDLMTLSVSGPDNLVTARVGWLCGGRGREAGRPLQQGESTPKGTLDTLVSDDLHQPTRQTPGCTGTKKLPYPERPAG